MDSEPKQGDLVSGTIERFERDAVIVNLDAGEGMLPRSESVPRENYGIGERILALVLEVKRSGSQAEVILSRAHKDLVRRLFDLVVPEIAAKIIEVRKLEREPGYRTKVAVTSTDPKIDMVGACVGVGGTRIQSIIDTLNGEKIDIDGEPWSWSRRTSSPSPSALRERTSFSRASSPSGTSTS